MVNNLRYVSAAPKEDDLQVDIGAINPTIVVPAFRRAQSLTRLLRSIDSSILPADTRLVISLEGGASDDVVSVAENFEFRKCKKFVIRRKKRLGLRSHIVACGDLSEKYGSIILLEDDLSVDPYFYVFACSAANFYLDETRVAGVALYSPEICEYSGLPFFPLRNGYDNFFAQVPCSWGQLWTFKQWSSFRKWYNYREKLSIDEKLPRVVIEWPDTSWKKFFAAYLVDTERYFVYPYVSYTTNFSDSGGQHISKGTSLFQVSLSSPFRDGPKPSFCPLDQIGLSCYDAFFEPEHQFIFDTLGIGRDDISIDIFKTRSFRGSAGPKFVLTTRSCTSYLRAYPLRRRPPELNLLSPPEDVSGSRIVLTELRFVEYWGDYSWAELRFFFKLGNFQRLARRTSFLGFRRSRLAVYWARFYRIITGQH